MAAVLACGTGALLSHRTAADALGLLPYTGGSVDITIPGRCRRRVPGIRIHRARRLQREDGIEWDGIPCTSPTRTLLDLADVVSARRLARAIENAERLGLYDHRAVADAIDRARGRPAASRLSSLVATYEGPASTKTEFERRALEFFEQAGLPRPRVNALVGTAESPVEVDFLWPERTLVVEADGYEWHRSRARFEDDRRRDQLLLAAGYAVVRITWRQLTREPQRVLSAVAGPNR
jgi:hypothetical protein